MLNLLDLENFLIENSDISKKFITDFFGFQKKTLYNEYEPFVIDLEDIAYWLESRKTTLKETLSSQYSKNIDYIIIKNLLQDNMQQTLKQGGHNKKLVLLTSDCFKMLCMRSKTEKADQVRKYYIELEKLIDKFKDIIIEQKDKKIKILENDLKKDIYPVGNYSYIFQEKDELGETFFRIGQSGNLKSRMANHNSSSIHKKIISFQIKTDNKLQFESCLRNSMFNFRYKNNKDYYKIPKDKIKDAIKICKNIVKNFKNDNIITGGSYNIDIDNDDDDYYNDYIDTKKMDFDIKKLFTKVCKCTMWYLYEHPSEAYYNGRKVSSNKLNKIILPESISDKILIVPVHRFEEYFEYINLSKNNITLKQLLKILFNYYNKEEITLQQLKLIPNDIDDYVNDAIKNHKTEKIYRINIVGSLCRYEGIREIYNNVYKLKLGS